MGPRDFAAPFLMERSDIADRVIPGEKVRIKSHVGGTTGIPIVAQANEFRAGNTRAKLDQGRNVIATNLGAKNDDQVLLAPQFVSQNFQCITRIAAGSSDSGIIAREECRDVTFRSFRNLDKVNSLAAQFDLLRINYV